MSAQAAAPTLGSIRRLSPALDAVIAPDAKIEKLADGFVWSEGPVWVKDGQYLVFSDVPANIMYRWSRTDGKSVFLQPSGYDGPPTKIFREPGSNGMALDARGDLLVCNHGYRAITKLDLKTKAKSVVVDRYEGKRFNSPNDLAVAKSGAIYFTDPPYGLEGLNASPAKELSFNGVYLRRADGSLAVVDDKLTFPNGVALSPDEKVLYVAVSDPEGPVIMAYDLGADGLPTSRKVFFDAGALHKAGGPGLPDGMCLDTEGRLYATGPGGVLVITPAGELIGVIETGGPIANCAFGEDGKTLFLTADKTLARVRLKTTGLVF
ncbi:SMP-30/gluconolactonase/LRE family protein [Caulobacter hibisci]|uniref:SMP-30/gluconolactonase/LRE family protein n=1 Tax=Caulobacter hibisci TaxID=2035993 RepID=A0ABS0T3H9_9CAUL|nr:SMP-30/gluconolactonase/LRE family protein [Caulobacter hibisci]MBI1685438.1 SMP-30/gluconolactonase/LRE family protein [Caulobacter hibisci]